MTDETQTPEETPAEERITVFDVWATFYERALVQMRGINTVNKADKQQYVLKAAEVAGLLTQLEVRLRG